MQEHGRQLEHEHGYETAMDMDTVMAMVMDTDTVADIDTECRESRIKSNMEKLLEDLVRCQKDSTP